MQDELATPSRDDILRKTLPEPILESSQEFRLENKSENEIRLSHDLAAVNLLSENAYKSNEDSKMQEPKRKIEIEISTERESKQYPASLKNQSEEIRIVEDQSLVYDSNKDNIIKPPELVNNKSL